MKLVTAQSLTGTPEPRVGLRRYGAIPQRQTLGHTRLTGQHTDHRESLTVLVNKCFGQVHQPATFGVYRHSGFGSDANCLAQCGISTQLCGIQFRKPATQIDGSGTFRESNVA